MVRVSGSNREPLIPRALASTRVEVGGGKDFPRGPVFSGMRMKPGVLGRFAWALILSCGPLSSAASSPSPSAAVEIAVSDILAIVQDPTADRHAKSRRVRASLVDRFDFRTTAKYALAQSWRTLSESERRRFVAQFCELLIWGYLDTIEEYDVDPASIRYQRAQFDGPGRATVSTFIAFKAHFPAGAGGRLTLSYRLRHARDRWRIYDVMVGGLSVIALYRRTLRREIDRAGIPGLFEYVTDELRNLKSTAAVSVPPRPPRR